MRSNLICEREEYSSEKNDAHSERPTRSSDQQPDGDGQNEQKTP